MPLVAQKVFVGKAEDGRVDVQCKTSTSERSTKFKLFNFRAVLRQRPQAES